MTLPPISERIDAQIAERAPWLFKGSPLSTLLRAPLARLLSFDATQQIAREIEHLDAIEIMDDMSTRLAKEVTATGLHRIPAEGPALIVCNHPTGIADAIVLWSALSKRRKDAYFFANRDILRVLPQLEPMIAPVEWRSENPRNP